MNKFVQLLIQILSTRGGVQLGTNVHVGPFSIISSPSTLLIGRDTYIGKFCTIQASGRIGRGVLIGNSVGIIGRYDHEFRTPGVLIRDAPWVGSSRELAALRENQIEIGDDVWIGFGSTILSGIRIGTGAIIAAGSTVVRDVDDFTIVAGSPATPRSMRFNGDSDKIAIHLAAIAARYGS